MKVGLMVLNFGGPRSADEVEPFLRNLLLDVLPGPGWLKGVAAPLIANRRTKIVGPHYAQIGWSPLVDTHHEQMAALARALGPDAPPTSSGMMFTRPTMAEGAAELLDAGVEGIVAVAMFPHYSFATTQAAFSMLHDALVEAGHPRMPVHWIGAYFDHPKYIEALASTIRKGVEQTPGTGPVHLLFSPHGLPTSYVRAGDPYAEQIRASIRAVIASLQWTDPWHVGWQSRVGPKQWLTPGTPEVLERLGRAGAKRVCIVPISFVSEHIETLHEIDIQYREEAEAAGIESFGRAPALGLEPAFIECLAELVRDAMAAFERYSCVRCLHPKPESHRRRKQCPNCRFAFPDYLRVRP